MPLPSGTASSQVLMGAVRRMFRDGSGAAPAARVINRAIPGMTRAKSGRAEVDARPLPQE